MGIPELSNESHIQYAGELWDEALRGDRVYKEYDWKEFLLEAYKSQCITMWGLFELEEEI